jgi:hypothetical protein
LIFGMTEPDFRPGQDRLAITADLGDNPTLVEVADYLVAIDRLWGASVRMAAAIHDQRPRIGSRDGTIARAARIQLASPLVVEILQSLPVQLATGALIFERVVDTTIKWQKHRRLYEIMTNRAFSKEEQESLVADVEADLEQSQIPNDPLGYPYARQLVLELSRFARHRITGITRR